jgi:ABC-type nitrate/sulfonate/bicarbonate transport system permease component
MLGKALIGGGIALALLGGVLLAALSIGTQMAQGGYSPSVQHYAESNAAAGNPLAFGLLGIGALLAVVGVVLTVARRTTR